MNPVLSLCFKQSTSNYYCEYDPILIIEGARLWLRGVHPAEDILVLVVPGIVCCFSYYMGVIILKDAFLVNPAVVTFVELTRIPGCQSFFDLTNCDNAP